MNSLLRCIALLAALATIGLGVRGSAQDHVAHGPTWGVHGMVLFGGRDGLYASHLPLFRPPHDRQLVVELRLDDPAADKALRAMLAGEPAQLWTLEPEHFELARLSAGAADPLRAFRATAYRGHFERGGTPERRDLRFRLVRVLIDRPLDPSVRTSATMTYDRIGRGDASFMVKRLDARSDFDHIVKIDRRACPATVVLPRNGIAAPTPSEWQEKSGCRAIGPTIYFETDDLR